ncbi:CPBP family intramembrane glutamic endopeptidase [Methanobrevibacter sp.]|uniref:CPBP family intramembrane glutamic endopeptidase n=1 Tax=Methanobrevibacter sp. TaxID=66852 RepID=UPI002E790E18|nr:type II CAAX endopeptidase family protein [Methanobrevibacter sp.]MEE1336059.1 type II CAAX endopeptidase family protein [Methanobrevibacter sp.]
MNIHKKFFSKIGANYLILGIMAIVLQIILVNIISVTNPEYLHDINIVTVISSLCNYILPFPIFYWLMKKLDDVEIEKAGVSVKTFILYTGITITLMWIGNIAGLIITMLLSGAIQNDIANPVQELINSANIWINLVIISIFAPICEEILFRKFLIDRTIKYGAKVSIILSAVLFAFFHGNLNQFFYAFLMGGFFAYVYIKTGKITYTIILHAIVNIMGSVVSLILANSVTNIQINPNPIDAVIIIGYVAIILSFLIIGLYGLTKIKKARFNGSKTQISLKNPFKTVYLNIGMILFILFFIGEMVYQIL